MDMLTKSALRILLLSIFRASINYSLFCSFPIHTRSSANAEGSRAHCQLKSCKMLHKCSTDCFLKGLQPVNDLQCHSRSLPLLPFDRPYDFLLVFHCKYISVLHRFRNINTYLANKLRRHMTLTTPTWGTVCNHNTNTSRANLRTKCDDSIISHYRKN